MLPKDKQSRKEVPLARGLLHYFPDALAAVAHTSYIGNQQHNPGESLHWAKEKSADHADCIVRHLIDQGKLDTDGIRHSAKVAWRALALLQTEIEEDAEAVVDKYGDKLPPYLNDDPDPRVWEPDEVAGDVLSVFPPPRVTYAFQDARSHGMYNHLRQMGVMAKVAHQIVMGTTFQPQSLCARGWVYISGPMRGWPDFNFPAFEEARNALWAADYHVISPADVDRHDENRKAGVSQDSTVYALRDFWCLFFIAKQSPKGCIALLPGWQGSVGASAELALAKWLGLTVLDSKGQPYTE